MKLRPYQDRCVNAVFDALGSHRSALVDMATGLGKTVIFSHVADRWPGRVLIMAHRDELIRQAADKVQAITGVRPGIEMAGERVYENGGIGRPKVVIASVQTLTSGDRLAKFDPSQFGLVITDEAHRGVAKSYRRVFAYFDRNPDSRRLGVTATPSAPTSWPWARCSRRSPSATQSRTALPTAGSCPWPNTPSTSTASTFPGSAPSPVTSTRASWKRS